MIHQERGRAHRACHNDKTKENSEVLVKFLAAIPFCSQYLSVFSEHGFTTLAKLVTLSSSQLVDMKVETGHAFWILKRLKRLQQMSQLTIRSALEEISKGEFDVKQLSPQPHGAEHYIGLSSHGKVYTASYKGTSVAVKVFFDMKSGQQEGKLLQQLSHENILFVLGYSPSLLVMELAGQEVCIISYMGFPLLLSCLGRSA